MNENANRRNRMLRYIAPSIMSMVCIFLFTIIDGIFVGRGVGSDGLGAVNIAFPFVMIYNALVMLTNIGGLTITAICVGEKDKEGADRAFYHSLLYTFAVCVVLSAVGTLFTRPLAILLGANDTFLEMACDYIFWYSAFIIPCGIGTALGGFCRNDGAPELVGIGTLIATSLNVFGDWLLVFPLHMGLKGAAIATGVSQTVYAVIVLCHFLRGKGQLRFHVTRLDPELLKMITVRGTPECVSQFCVPITTILTNKVLIAMVGSDAVNAYSVLCYAASFAVAVFAGTADGIQPLLGQSYGAKEERDLKYFFHHSFAISVIGAMVISLFMTSIWSVICTLFGVDDSTRACAMYAMPRYCWGFVVQAANVIIAGYLNATTRSRQAAAINILRSFVVNIICTLLIPRIFGADTIWLCFGIQEAIVLAAAAVILYRADHTAGKS